MPSIKQIENILSNSPFAAISPRRQCILLDRRRAQNIEIGISQMRISQDDIIEAIITMNEQKLTLDNLQILLPFLPTEEELQIVRDYVENGGDINALSSSEQFFVKMMDLVCIRKRISLWIFTMEFPFIIEKIRRKITGVATAIRLLMESKRLRKVLYLILTIGNYMNHGSCQGNAFGFLMEPTLDVLCTIKSNDEHMTLLAYVVHVLHTIDPDALSWTSDLDILWQVYKMEPDSIVTEIDALKRDMDSIKNELRLRKGAVIKIEELWLNRGIKISLNDIASRLRHLSKQGKHRFQAAA
eukprot:109956_1